MGERERAFWAADDVVERGWESEWAGNAWVEGGGGGIEGVVYEVEVAAGEPCERRGRGAGRKG